MIINAAVVIIGAGSYGTALAVSLSKNGNKVVLWSYNINHAKLLKEKRYNNILLPGIKFPKDLHIEQSLQNAINSSKDILIVVPSYAFTNIILQIKPFIRKDSRITWATKGLESKTGRFFKDVIQDILGKYIPLAIISGPSFAYELANDLPTSIVITSTDVLLSKDLSNILNRKNFKIYMNTDIIGIQIIGVIKNIIAISVGISDGLGLGASARATLITKGLDEISNFGNILGADKKTFIGIAGLGDLVLTCTDDKSRNRRFGILLGKGYSIEEAKKEINQVIEGYQNIKEVLILSNKFKIKINIVEQIYKILYENKDIYKTIINLIVNF